jgi:hypothetical protein
MADPRHLPTCSPPNVFARRSAALLCGRSAGGCCSCCSRPAGARRRNLEYMYTVVPLYSIYNCHNMRSPVRARPLDMDTLRCKPFTHHAAVARFTANAIVMLILTPFQTPHRRRAAAAAPHPAVCTARCLAGHNCAHHTSLSHVTRHTSHVTRHTSHVTPLLNIIIATDH